MQLTSKQEMEEFYKNPDPWGYKTRPDDLKRIELILNHIPQYDYKNTLDIGCGEGLITQYLPGDEILGIDLSETAVFRADKSKRIKYKAIDINEMKPKKFDLIIATGVLYPHYVTEETIKKIIKMTRKTLVTCHAREVGNVKIDLKPTKHTSFPYDGMIEDLFTYDLSNT